MKNFLLTFVAIFLQTSLFTQAQVDSIFLSFKARIQNSFDFTRYREETLLKQDEIYVLESNDFQTSMSYKIDGSVELVSYGGGKDVSGDQLCLIVFNDNKVRSALLGVFLGHKDWEQIEFQDGIWTFSKGVLVPPEDWKEEEKYQVEFNEIQPKLLSLLARYH